ncbi:hypothetical protein PHYBOEH_008996 [Phytophthora boehmeriae]|uniref:RxLR effector protein n=1 Tax=Phytophthora boehmeriae TaxID=109152 RepID=A0A8T1VXA5_9STRA|nr:hypothetical protein PHYBOEH_008996 [Phytophthora boehmeriae]
MRLVYVAIMAVVTVLAGIDTTSAISDPKLIEISTINSPTFSTGPNDSTKRSLRGDDEVHVERRLLPLDTLLKFERLMDKNVTPLTFYNKLGLQHLGQKMFTNPKLDIYKAYVKYYHKMSLLKSPA